MPKLAATALLLFLAAAAPASAALTSPHDGETISSRPTFTFDFAEGYAAIELADEPDVMTAGDDAGAFVDPEHTIFDSVRDGALENTWIFPVPAGSYYLHSRESPDDGPRGGWSPTIRVIVRDEPPQFHGWTAKARRVKRTKRCARRLKVWGVLRYGDNSKREDIRYTVAVSAGGRTLGRSRGRDTHGSANYRTIVCTRATALDLTATLRDPAGQQASGPPRTLTLR